MDEINARSMFHKIIKRRWFFLTPVVIAVALSLAYSKQVKIYRSSAIITFHTEYLVAEQDPGLMKVFQEKVRSLVGSLLYGEALKDITKIAYPEIDQNLDIAKFNSKAGSLGSQSGIQLAFRKDNYRALTVSYDSSESPQDAYRVVKATIESIYNENSKHTQRRIKSSTSFLQKEIKNYKKSLEKVEEKIFRLKSGMALNANFTSGEDSNINTNYDTTVAQAIKYQENLPDLQFKMGVVEREISRIKEKLKNKNYIKDASKLPSTLDINGDNFISEIRKSIIEKRQELSSLTSQGILKEHPKRKLIESEIKNFQKMETERLRKLNSSQDKDSLELAKLRLEQRLRTELDKKTRELEQFKDKIKIMQSFKESVTSDKDSVESSFGALSRQRTKLMELEHEKMILGEAYNQAATELEMISRRGRAESGDIAMRINIDEEPKIPNGPLALAHMSTVLTSVIISLALGVSLIALIEMLDTSFHTAKDLEDAIKIPVLGRVEKISTMGEIKRKANIEILMICFLTLVCLFSGIIVKLIF